MLLKHVKHLIFRHILEEEDFVDVTLSAGGQTLKGHKVEQGWFRHCVHFLKNFYIVRPLFVRITIFSSGWPVVKVYLRKFSANAPPHLLLWLFCGQTEPFSNNHALSICTLQYLLPCNRLFWVRAVPTSASCWKASAPGNILSWSWEMCPSMIFR